MLVALGGGVVGDIAGFAAAIYQRGMPFVQVPTTLLAQVDSSVGGKTGVNHPLGKNMIGAFYQPRAVLIDTDCLATLPDARAVAAGLAEVIKYGAIRDAAFFAWLEAQHGGAAARATPQALDRRHPRSCRDQGRDRRRRRARGRRARAAQLRPHVRARDRDRRWATAQWLHGEAVAAGMVIAAQVSQRLGRIDAADRAAACARSWPARSCRSQAPALGFERWMALMARDKKVRAGAIRFILLDAIGRARASRPTCPTTCCARAPLA